MSGIESSAIAGALAARAWVREAVTCAPPFDAPLNLMPGGVVRVSLVHYNTLGEITRFRAILNEVI